MSIGNAEEAARCNSILRPHPSRRITIAGKYERGEEFRTLPEAYESQDGKCWIYTYSYIHIYIFIMQQITVSKKCQHSSVCWRYCDTLKGLNERWLGGDKTKKVENSHQTCICRWVVSNIFYFHSYLENTPEKIANQMLGGWFQTG